jgi:hypothetical protein
MVKYNMFKKFRRLFFRPRWTQKQIDRIKKNGKEMYERICGDKDECQEEVMKDNTE